MCGMVSRMRPALKEVGMKKFLLAMLVCLPFGAQAQEVEQGNGLVCDTVEQVEKFVALHNQGLKNTEVMAELNNGTVVCVINPAAFYRGKAVKHVMADGMVYDVVSILVIGMYAGQWIPVAPYEQFTLQVKRQGDIMLIRCEAPNCMAMACRGVKIQDPCRGHDDVLAYVRKFVCSDGCERALLDKLESEAQYARLVN